MFWQFKSYKYSTHTRGEQVPHAVVPDNLVVTVEYDIETETITFWGCTEAEFDKGNIKSHENGNMLM